jgi:hypothetical protein
LALRTTSEATLLLFLGKRNAMAAAVEEKRLDGGA